MSPRKRLEPRTSAGIAISHKRHIGDSGMEVKRKKTKTGSRKIRFRDRTLPYLEPGCVKTTNYLKRHLFERHLPAIFDDPLDPTRGRDTRRG